MSVLTKVERNSTKGRLFLTGVLLALVVGGVTMVYPFLLMVSGAMRSDMDVADMSVIPAYLHDPEMLVRKFLETKFNYSPLEMNAATQQNDYSFKKATVAESVNTNATADLESFASGPMPRHWQTLGGTLLYKSIRSAVYDQLLKRVQKRFGNLTHYNRESGSPLVSWKQFSFPRPRYAVSRSAFSSSPALDIYYDLLAELPLAYRSYINLSATFLDEVIYPQYTQSGLKAYNAAHSRKIGAFSAFALPQRVPGADQPQLRKEWIAFALGICNLSFVRSDATDVAYRQFLRDRYGSIEELNRRQGSQFSSFEAISLPADNEWVDDASRRDYGAFLASLHVESLRLVGPEFSWRDAMQAKYVTVEALNVAHGTYCETWDDCRIPMSQEVRRYVFAHAGQLRRQFALRNFKVVFQEIFVQGRSFWNTMIYVGLALLFSLTIQPLVAYSLSRFNPPGTWRFIMIFMATMAFPPMVSFIPQFLILKKLHLLNTFIGLVLPVTINGYLIFMLKGFFDSIPDNLYEAATIDGASEMRIFWTITMALSKPILAVVALNTFRMVWMSFMYPMIICSDESMQVLAVWAHEFQKQAPSSAVFASILVSSLPTLLIFLVTQRTIMQGIAVPSEK